MAEPLSSSDATGVRSRGRRGSRSFNVAATAIDAVQGFCLGPEGRAAAASELRKLGLPTDRDHVDDVCQAVVVNVWARLEHGDPEAEPGLYDAAVAYARRSIRNAAVDMLRAARPDRLHDVLAPRGRSSGGSDANGGPGADGLSTDADDRNPIAWSDHDADRRFAPEVLWAIQRMQVARPRLETWVVSAALATTHLADHPTLALLPGIPVPQVQSPAKSAGHRWAGLAYAGRLDCWADPETGAVRERRSRALKRLDRTLTEAVEMAVADTTDNALTNIEDATEAPQDDVTDTNVTGADR